MSSLLWLLFSPAFAELPLPSFREELVVAAWISIDERITRACRWPEGAIGIGPPLTCDVDRLDDAISEAQGFLKHVTDDGRLHYLIGLAHRHAGRITASETSFRASIAASPDRKEAWFDLGEILSSRGTWDQAQHAFERVTELFPEGPGSWVGWLQLAQVAAHQQRPRAFEHAIRNALQQGFTFRVIQGQPAWRTFLADPVMHDAVDRMVRYYGEPGVIESLQEVPTTP
jgi:tetratricopeptide (TPR) repeat protein